MFQQPAQGGMARLMVGYALALIRSRYFSAFLQTSDDTVDRIHEVFFLDKLFTATGGNQSGFVADIGNIGSGETGSLACQEFGIDAFVDFDRTQMYSEYLLTLVQVGQFHVNLTVETSGTKQRLIQDVGTVRGGQDDNTAVGAETVHFRKQLVQRVFTFIVAVHVYIFATGTADGIDLVDEYDTRSFLFCLAEQVTYAGSTYADEHFNEVRTGQGEERNVGFSGYSLGQ